MSEMLRSTGLKRLMLGFVAIILVAAGCKKDKGEDYSVQSDPRDSAYLYTQDIYLWYDRLPSISSFQPRNLADIYEVMDKVRSYQPLDKWSFVETKLETELSDKGQDTDFGFMVKFAPGNRQDLRVSYVYSASSAGEQGVKRTWRVKKVNGRTIDGGSQSDINYINEVFFGNHASAQFEFGTPEGLTVSKTLQKKIYTLNTVLFSKVYTVGQKKAGYFVFNQFNGDESVNELVSVINGFQSQGVSDVVVDLRYNRGGLVTTQDTLANMLAPKSVGWGKKIMHRYVFNNKYSRFNETTMFHKVGNLDLSRVIFIVSPSSASASELLINNLKPVMSVKLIGETRTYGKPVGFFPIPVFDYNIYPVSFKSVNSSGNADYFEGFAVDKNVADDLNHDFGDTEEAALKEALYFIGNNGAFSASAQAQISSQNTFESAKVREINAGIAEHLPAVTIENRPSKMPPAIRDLQR